MLDAEPLVGRILDDEGLTGDLDEPEAAALVTWLVANAEHIAATVKTMPEAQKQVAALARVGRAIAAATIHRDPATAKAAGLPWPPTNAESPAEVLAWLLKQLDARNTP